MNYRVADDFLCFFALLETIISDASEYTCFTQTTLAELFGITVPVGERTTIKNVRFSNNIEEYGTSISVKDINEFFRINKIPLVVSYIPSNFFDETIFTDLVAEKNRNSHIIFAFCYGLLYNEPQNNDVGHVVLLEDVNVKSDTIKIYDPGPRNFGSKIVRSDDMIYAMKRRGGIYLFEKNNN